MRAITFRPDDEVEAALAALTADGTSQSAVIREAIMAAYRRKRSAELRAETAALAADPEDRAEMRAVLAEMDELRAW
jgi:predicted transcriptional regulator